jgi:hypothetical protein
MIGFKDLKALIVRSCRTVDDRSKLSNINDRFNFIINIDKLEKLLNSKSDLHVAAFAPIILSRVPDIEEIQLVSEYVHKKEEINTIFDGNTRIATFMLYCDMEGKIHIDGDDMTALTSKQIYDAINADEPIKDLALLIAEEFPVYRTMVVRRFDKRKDKFVYSIYFRSSYSMITYINELKSNGMFDITDKEEPEEPVEEEVEESTTTEKQ